MKDYAMKLINEYGITKKEKTPAAQDLFIKRDLSRLANVLTNEVNSNVTLKYIRILSVSAL